MKTKYTFWELLQDYKIEIPKIQRDYAQGRNDQAIDKIADKFLSDIKESILTNNELNLDFVYGKIENSILIPIDGQQRLTTLFLIHWYIALKENKLSSETKSILAGFTYETRISSQDFCKKLVSENFDYHLIKDSISISITDSKWYFLSWELDPTVAAMLNMLDRIHHKFKDIQEPMFEKLRKELNITFQFLALEQFKLTDELYIKMNARGKPLTEFENFKANFSPYLKTLEEKSKLDNEWLDIFWNIEKNETAEIITENVDRKFFCFFKNISLNFYAEKNDIDKDFIENFDLFETLNDVYKDNEYVKQIMKILDALITYADTDNIFQNVLSPSLSYGERLRFYALSRFFVLFGSVNEENKGVLKNWLRISQNLINNTLIQSAANYKDAIRSLNELSNHMADIYTYISLNSTEIKYFLKSQRQEEGLKAKLILEDDKWEHLFISIEQHSYFDGQVGFILQYSKDDGYNYNKFKFENYSAKLASLFSDEYKEKYDFLFQRALLTMGDYLPHIGNSGNTTFCVFDEALRTKTDHWRKVFNGAESTLILKKLLNNIEKEHIQDSLELIVKNYKVSDWRKLIIENPETIAYCQYRQIRWYADNNVILLSKAQLNGRHKDLYTWDMYKRVFQQKTFAPFSDISWYKESTSYEQPSIVLSGFSYHDNRFAIEIKNDFGRISLKLIARSEAEMPEAIKESLKSFGFEGNKTFCVERELQEKITQICDALKSIEQE